MASFPRVAHNRRGVLAFAVRARACARGGCGGALRGVAVEGGGYARAGGFAEVASRQLPEEACRERREVEGSPLHGEEGHPGARGGSGSTGEASSQSRCRAGQAQPARVSAHGGRPVEQGSLGRVASGGGRAAAQGRGEAGEHDRVSAGSCGNCATICGSPSGPRTSRRNG